MSDDQSTPAPPETVGGGTDGQGSKSTAALKVGGRRSTAPDGSGGGGEGSGSKSPSSLRTSGSGTKKSR